MDPGSWYGSQDDEDEALLLPLLLLLLLLLLTAENSPDLEFNSVITKLLRSGFLRKADIVISLVCRLDSSPTHCINSPRLIDQ